MPVAVATPSSFTHLLMRGFVMICCLAMFAGCAPSTAGGPKPTTEVVRVGDGGSLNVGVSTLKDAPTRVVPVAFDRVWTVLPGVLDSLGIPINSRNPATGQIGNTGLEVRRTLGGTIVSRYFSCGSNVGGGSAVSFDLFLVLIVQAKPDPSGGTSLTSAVSVRGKPITTSGGWIPCESTGLLEQRIVERVQASAGR